MPTCRLTYLVCDVADSFSISKITSIVISLSYVLSISFSREKIAHNFSPWTSYRTWQRDFTFYFTRVSNNKVILFVFHAVLLVEGKPRLLFFFFFSLLFFRTTFTSRRSHTRVRALSRTPSKVSEVAPGSNVYPPFPQEKDPYLKARTHEMIQLFDLCHVLPFYLVAWGGRLLNGICVYTIFPAFLQFRIARSRYVVKYFTQRVVYEYVII